MVDVCGLGMQQQLALPQSIGQRSLGISELILAWVPVSHSNAIFRVRPLNDVRNPARGTHTLGQIMAKVLLRRPKKRIRSYKIVRKRGTRETWDASVGTDECNALELLEHTIQFARKAGKACLSCKLNELVRRFEKGQPALLLKQDRPCFAFCRIRWRLATPVPRDM